MEEEGKKRFILVHGMCHGAWCWYKLATLLRAAGHRVTVPDLAACGVNPKRLHELRSFSDYSEPLMEAISSIPSGERVVLVAHSFGGSTVALAMERFADKVSAAIFATAMMPSTTTPFATIGQEFSMKHPPEYFMDSKFVISQDHEISWKTITFGPNYMKERLYQPCAPEDLALATMLVRPSSLFKHDDPLVVSKENYGSVSRVFVVCKEDLAIKEDFQRWMIEQSPEVEVRRLKRLVIWSCFQSPKSYAVSSLRLLGSIHEAG